MTRHAARERPRARPRPTAGARRDGGHGRDGQDGGILIGACLAIVALLAASAFAVDLGRIAVTSRDQQGATDRAALDALLALRAGGDPWGAVETSLGRNPGVTATGMAAPRRIDAVEVGRFDAAAGTWVVDPDDPQAVRVVTSSSVSALLLRGDDGDGPRITNVTREAIAMQDVIAALTARTTTVQLTTEDAILLNGLLGGLLGTTVSLDAVGWAGILGSTVNLASLAAEMAVGTADELLSTQVGADEVPMLVANAIERDGDTAHVALRQLALTLPPLPAIALGDVLRVTSGDPGLRSDVAVGDLLLATAQVATGDHAVALDLSALGLVDVSLRVVQPPVLAVGRAGQDHDGQWRTVASTAQTSLEIAVPLIGTLGVSVPGLASIELADDLRVRVDTGVGEATLTHASCAGGGSAGVQVDTAAVRATIDPFQLARIRVAPLGIPLATVDVGISAETELAASSAALAFTAPFPAEPEGVGTSDPGLGAGLLDGLQVHADVGLLGLINLPLGTLVAAVTNLLQPVLGTLDGVLEPLLRTLGVQLGAGEVQLTGVDCTGRMLVR